MNPILKCGYVEELWMLTSGLLPSPSPTARRRAARVSPSFSISKLAPSILIQLPPIKSNNFERMRSGEGERAEEAKKKMRRGGRRGSKIHIGFFF